METCENSLYAGGKINFYSHFGNNFMLPNKVFKSIYTKIKAFCNSKALCTIFFTIWNIWHGYGLYICCKVYLGIGTLYDMDGICTLSKGKEKVNSVLKMTAV